MTGRAQVYSRQAGVACLPGIHLCPETKSTCQACQDHFQQVRSTPWPGPLQPGSLWPGPPRPGPSSQVHRSNVHQVHSSQVHQVHPTRSTFRRSGPQPQGCTYKGWRPGSLLIAPGVQSGHLDLGLLAEGQGGVLGLEMGA